MKKLFSVAVSLCLVAALLISCNVLVFASAGTAQDYTIVSPYADVVWEGDNAWSSYKGNLHTHSFVSDADVDYRDMILEYYEQGFDFLSMTDHGITGKAWNEKTTEIPLYTYQRIIGNVVHTLTDEENSGVLSGTQALQSTGAARGYGMTNVIGGNELNALTMTKSHVNAIFLPAGVGDNYLGFENDFEGAVKLADKAGAVSFINHPGDWIGSGSDRTLNDDPEIINYFADILLRYDSCLGMEVFNERNSPTHYDRDLWDNLLMACLPYGKNVIGFSNSDAHVLENVDSSFSLFMMPENTQEAIRDTMNSGAFFMVTRIMGEDDILGPATHLDARNTDLAYPTFNYVKTEGHKIYISVKNAYNIQFVANGEVVASEDITSSDSDTLYCLDVDSLEGHEDFLYIRCQLLGEGGITLTQALTIDNGSGTQTYEKDSSLQATVKELIRIIKSLRFFVIFQELISLMK